MNYNDLNDYEIIYLISENDEYAKELMLKKYEPIVYNIANKFSRSAKLAGLEIDDLVQEGYLALALSFNKFNPNKNTMFYTYVVSAIKKRMLNIIRANTTNGHQLLNNSLSLEFELFEDSKLMDSIEDVTIKKPLDLLVEREYFNKIKDILYGLSLMEASVFELKINGFKLKEMEELLQVSRVYISSILGRIRRNFNLIIEN